MSVMTPSESNSTTNEAPPKVAFLNDPKVRSLIFQILLALIVVYLVWAGISNMNANLRAAGVASGFGFLSNNAGFAVSQSLIDFDVANATYGRIFFIGVLNTLILAVIGIFFATIIGVVIGIARLSDNWVVRSLATSYVEFMRNLPLLLQIFIWYFGVLRLLPSARDPMDFGGLGLLSIRGYVGPKPIWGDGSVFILYALIIAVVASVIISRWSHSRQMATGQIFPAFWTSIALIVGLPIVVFLALGAPLTWDVPEMGGFRAVGGFTVLPEFIALLLALSTYTAAFIAEIVRAGILGVYKGQTEAAHALGLRQNLNLRLIVIPQALRIIIPPLTSQYLNLTKNSSLAVAIAYPDLTSVFAGTALNLTGQAVEIVSITMLTYLTFSLLTSAFMNWYNNRVAMVER